MKTLISIIITLCLLWNCSSQTDSKENENTHIQSDTNETTISEGEQQEEVLIELDPIENAFVYEFMNEFILKDSSNDQKSWTKLMSGVIPMNYPFESLIKSMDTLLSDDDIEFMIWQIDPIRYRWNCNAFDKVVCLESQVVDSIFAIGKEVIETEERTIYIDAWEEFRKEFGNGGIHSYSKPIFNKARTIVIIQHSGQGDWTLGSGGIYIFQKTEEEWKLLKDINLWIS